MPNTRQHPNRYNPRDFPPVAVTVDVALFTYHDAQFQILLIERGIEPFKGRWALPGGFLKPEESLEAAAARELFEETGIRAPSYLQQLKTYGNPGRDPRMRVVTTCFVAIVPAVEIPRGGSDAKRAELMSVSEVESGKTRLAFDHGEIFSDAVEHIRQLLETDPIATRLCGSEFTLTQLREVYESVWNCQLEPANFRRKLETSVGFVEDTGRQAGHGRQAGRPARCYRAGGADVLEPRFKRPVAARRRLT